MCFECKIKQKFFVKQICNKLLKSFKQFCKSAVVVINIHTAYNRLIKRTGMNERVNNAVQGPSNDIIQCKNCGNAMKKGAKFCPECGEKVLQSDTVICPECGKEVPQGKFCLNVDVN